MSRDVGLVIDRKVSGGGEGSPDTIAAVPEIVLIQRLRFRDQLSSDDIHCIGSAGEGPE